MQTRAHRCHTWAAPLAAASSAAASADEAIEGVETVVTMLPTGKHAASVYLDDGLLSKLPKGSLALDCSTIDASTAQLIGKAAAEVGVLYLDSPVSGGTAAAAEKRGGH